MGIAGTADFAQRLSERLGRPEQARERNETDEHLAERLVQDWMNTTGYTEAQLAVRLRRETPMTRAWIAQRLSMGSASYVSHLTNGNRPDDRH